MNILDLPVDDFLSTLPELRAQGVDTDALLRQYRQRVAKPSYGEGRSPVFGGFASKPAGSTGMGAIRGLRPEFMSGFRGLLGASVDAATAPADAYRGLIAKDDMMDAALGTAGLAMGANPRALLSAPDQTVVAAGTPRIRGLLDEFNLSEATTPFFRQGSEDFDAPREGGGRSRDPALYTRYSSKKQTGVAPYDWSVEGVRSPRLSTPPTAITTPDLEGGRLFGFTADSTPIDEFITRVNDIDLPRPVLQQGGHAYPDQGLGFASELSAMRAKTNAWDAAHEAGEVPYVTPMVMGPKGADFSSHLAHTLGQAIRGSADRIDPTFTPQLNARMAETFPGLLDPRLPAWIESLPGGQRSAFVKAMDTAPALNVGAPSVAALRWGLTQPELRDASMLDSGFRVFRPAYDSLTVPDAGLHHTYNATVGREGPSMTLGAARPWTVMFPDAAYDKIAPGVGNQLPSPDAMPKDLRSFQMNPNISQIMDAEWVDTNQRFDEILSTLGQQEAQDYATEAMINRAARAGR